MKIIVFFCSIFCLTSTIRLHAQIKDSITPVGFKSFQEYSLLTSENTDELRLLLLLNDDISEEYYERSKETLTTFFSELKNEGLSRYSEAKQIKKIHSLIHERFLVKYEEISPFHEILESGTYNCVSATALFVLTLEELGIPYAIQELPTHAYVIAYPGSKNISVEMTSPKDGAYMPSRKDISKTVNTLVDYKLVSREELASKGQREVYNEFFYRDQTINLKQLASLQFYNEAIVKHDEKEIDAAYEAIKKANLLYGGESYKSTFFQDEILISLLEKATFDNMREIQYMIEYSNLDNTNRDKIYYDYGVKVIQNQLIESGKKKFVDSTYTYISENLTDTVLMKQISELYYIGLSDYYASAYNLTKQLEYAELAYNLNPNNVKTQSWLAKCLIRNLTSKDYNDGILEQLELEMEEKPFLKAHNYFQMFYFYSCSETSSEYYFNSEEELGKKYFDIAVNVMKKMEDPEVLDQHTVGMLYAAPGAYYIRQKDYEKALELLNKGLILAPDHERILARIEIAEDKLKTAPPRSVRLKKKEANKNIWDKTVFEEE